ncbi:hypothetical protein M3I54_36965 [Paraburkholderia sp. CNPSo 3274]|uniref:hypothetical protein n=1 Tax=Paraburkholderia sp. CNPSo 3274 TaxID=2940932 RepID=UPI0020B6C35C|nr:hypothetical protein [Paraburkholderia sp. CNPSo 3274]MCP3712456.1 hypothetical protein [Paraburkholderia sp. CNPSo 3274]
MEIDLREVHALHARFAREHFVIDLENQVKALPAPLLLAHEPAASTSAVRRAWNARWRLGRTALMVAGGAAVCGLLGMGVARLIPLVHGDRSHVAASTDLHATSSARVDIPTEASVPAASAPALTSQDLLTGPGRANWSAAVDPATVLRQAPQTRESVPTSPMMSASAPDEQKALASPLRQHVVQVPQPQTSAPAAVKPVPAAAPNAAVTPAQPKEDQPAPRPVVRHVGRPHTSPARTEQQPSVETAKSPAAPGQRNGDVQLF